MKPGKEKLKKGKEIIDKNLGENKEGIEVSSSFEVNDFLFYLLVIYISL